MTSSLQLIVQLLVIVIVIGVTYNLWKTAKAFGGIIGTGLKWIGLGIVFFSLEALDRVLGELSFLNSITIIDADLTHNLVLLIGLLFSAIGFSKLTKIAK